MGVFAHGGNVFPCVSVGAMYKCLLMCFPCSPSSRSLEICHGMSLGCCPTLLASPLISSRPPPCQKSTKFAPLTSGSDPHDTSHYYHHPLETQQHRGLRHDSAGRWCIGLMSSAPWALCLGYVAFMISIHKKPKYLGCAMGLYMGPICVVSVKQPGRLAG